ncbi:MAG TPA: NADH-quinone oxidoreductase subunit C [Thermoanaerobaculaceae bacterium]|nr:NADH-quinone oxidoreductase subunit C [Thermoanaerobaculaceae bacterium]
MTVTDYETDLKVLFPGSEVRRTQARTFWIGIERDALLDAVKTLRDKLGIRHLTTIVGEDMRDHFLLSYIVSGSVVVVLQVKVDREKPEVPTLALVTPGAAVYERELHDLLGIVPVGHPDLRRQVLPEDWPAGVYPLRKDAVLPKPAAEAEGGKPNA